MPLSSENKAAGRATDASTEAASVPTDELQPGAAAHHMGDRAVQNKQTPDQDRAGPAAHAGQLKKLRKAELQPKQAASTLGAKALKPRKKEFLKRRKLKKKGLLHLLDEEPEEDLEIELMQDRHKPRFGEQAMAPLKASPPAQH